MLSERRHRRTDSVRFPLREAARAVGVRGRRQSGGCPGVQGGREWLSSGASSCFAA